MMEASQIGRTENGTLAPTGGEIVPFQPQPLAQIPPAEAPPVLWDVGMDMLDYPEFYNAKRDGKLVEAESTFWNEIIDENYQSLQHVYLITNSRNRTYAGPSEGETSTGSTAIITTQIGGDVVPSQNGSEGGSVDGAGGTANVNVPTPLPMPCLTLSLACGSGEPEAQPLPTANGDTTSSEESVLEGEELGDYGATLQVGMMFRNRDAFKQHMAIFAIAKKFCCRHAKSDPSMMVLKCISSSCKWRVYAIRLKESEVFEVRKVDHIHSYSTADRGGYQGQATSAVI
ncbi:SWIM-type domain-containing protein [Raphanus sativus]|nr:SWIM-type domain-containing protein [Raphanus sativus]